MTYVALAEAAALVVVVLAFAGLLRSMSRAHARREDLLVNQLLNAVGRTWQPPPAAATWGDEIDEIEKLEDGWPEWTATPEQQPVY